MNINLNTRHSSYYLEIEADNVKISEDIESRKYPKDENGKHIPNRAPERDIKTDSIDDIARVLSDMIYYRKAEYDSSELIRCLFEKLPPAKGVELSEELAKRYWEDAQ